jgi:hypothetical protein
MPQQHNTAFRRGAAIVRIQGDSFAATEATYDGRAISFHGRVRVVKFQDGVETQISLGASVDRTYPIGRIGSIEWLAGEASA